MKLLLFGGTFDPPHKGHMCLLGNAIAAVQPDRVFVVPAHIPPHKDQSHTPPEVRLAMCACFQPLFPALTVSDMELVRAGKSYTIDTVEALLYRYPGAEIFLCIGSDMLLSFTTWHRYRELLGLVTLVAHSRRQEDAQPVMQAVKALCAEGARVLFAPGAVLEVSSSQIRAEIAAGKDGYTDIPPPADAIAREAGLYKQG